MPFTADTPNLLQEIDESYTHSYTDHILENDFHNQDVLVGAISFFDNVLKREEVVIELLTTKQISHDTLKELLSSLYENKIFGKERIAKENDISIDSGDPILNVSTIFQNLVNIFICHNTKPDDELGSLIKDIQDNFDIIHKKTGLDPITLNKEQLQNSINIKKELPKILNHNDIEQPGVLDNSSSAKGIFSSGCCLS